MDKIRQAATDNCYRQIMAEIVNTVYYDLRKPRRFHFESAVRFFTNYEYVNFANALGLDPVDLYNKFESIIKETDQSFLKDIGIKNENN